MGEYLKTSKNLSNAPVGLKWKSEDQSFCANNLVLILEGWMDAMQFYILFSIPDISGRGEVDI